jgi:ribosomal protein S18 acetylase RimI-like enzyme
MGVDADEAAGALAQTWQHLQRATPPGGWTVRDGGAIAMVTGVRAAMLNGVWSERVNPDPDIVARLVDRVAATGLPYCLQLRPGGSPALARLAMMRDMSEDRESPLMVLEDRARLSRAQRVTALDIRQLDPEDAELHAAVAAAGFEAPEEMMRQLITPTLLRLPGVRCYLGEADGHPVTTGIGVTLGPFTGILNIATAPADRGRGYGAAITARAVSDGLAAGASWSWLQSSAAGYGVYERLGFQTLESWKVWLRES